MNILKRTGHAKKTLFFLIKKNKEKNLENISRQ